MARERVSAPGETLIVGAGVVGAASALLLARAGHSVLLLDPRGLCGGTSHGNAGGVHVGAIQPFASPGVLGSALRMLADPVGPLRVDWRHLPRLTPWLLRFLRNATEPRMRAAAAASAAINHTAVAAWQEVAAMAGASRHLHAVGWLKVYDREQDFASSATERQLMEAHGFGFEVLDAAGLYALEPALRPGLIRGIWQPDSLFVDNPGRAVRAMAEAAIAAGARFRQDEVRAIRAGPEGVVATTSGGEVHAAHAVLAAGAWAGPLAAQLGCPVPLDTERGYHVMLPTPARSIGRPVMYPRRRFVLCPMEEGLRITACVEFAGLERDPDYRRIEKLLPFATGLLPGLEARVQARWLGYRPSLPDGLPVIDTDATGRVVLAFGHGHLGLTQGPATARAVLALVEGGSPPFPLAPFRAARFAAG